MHQKSQRRYGGRNRCWPIMSVYIQETGVKSGRRTVQGCKSSKPTAISLSFSRTLPPKSFKSPQIVAPTGDQMFIYMCLWGTFVVQTYLHNASPCFPMGAGDPKSGSYNWMPSILPSDLSPQPSRYLYKWKMQVKKNVYDVLC